MSNSATITETFDRYERMPRWTVSAALPSCKAASFPAVVYGEARAEALATGFLRRLNDGGDWATEYARIPGL